MSELRGLEIVREVFRRVATGDTTVADLYAPDAVIEYGSDGRVQGREAIRAFYAASIAAQSPKPVIEHAFVAPPYHVAILTVPMAAGVQRAVDLFRLGGDEITSLEIFTRRPLLTKPA